MRSRPAAPDDPQPIPPLPPSMSTAPSTVRPSPPPAPEWTQPPSPPSTGYKAPPLSLAEQAECRQPPALRYPQYTPGPPTDCCTTKCPRPADRGPGYYI